MADLSDQPPDKPRKITLDYEELRKQPLMRSCDKHGEWVSAATLDGPIVATECPECVKARQAAVAIASSGIPKKYVKLTLQDYLLETEDQKQVMEICRGFATSLERDLESAGDLLLLGTVGTGKTHLACAIASMCLRRGRTAKYLRAFSLFERLRDSRRWSAETTTLAIMEQITALDLLVLDEIDVHEGDENEQTYLLEVISRRHEDLKPTILVSNLMPTQLKDLLGIRAFDRVRGRGRVAIFEWESYRGREGINPP